jgi:hypothetical protein
MREGNLRLTFKDGEVVEVAIGTGLDETYSRLFAAACAEVNSGNSSTDIGARVIVFGCFWLEATCNNYLRQLLETTALSQLVCNSIWNTIERAQTEKKLAILASFQSDDASEALKVARRVFELRNRLAHFKESYDEIAPDFLDTDLEKMQTKLPEAELITLLLSPKLESSIEDIIRTKAWLDQIFEMFFKRARKSIDRKPQ